MAALNGTVISGDVYAWVIVFVLPINSAINPILYTFSSIDVIKVSNFGYKWVLIIDVLYHLMQERMSIKTHDPKSVNL